MSRDQRTNGTVLTLKKCEAIERSAQRIIESAITVAIGSRRIFAVDGASTTYVGTPRLVVLNSGDWRLYYIRDFNGGNNLPDRRIYTARSIDEGATWGGSVITMSTLAYEAGAAKLTDGTIRLFYTQPLAAGSSATVIASALSSDALGTTFTQESGYRISTPAANGALSFPVPARSTDSFRWRLYYSYYDAFNSTGDVRSALTGSPAPVALSPSTVYNSAGSIPLVKTATLNVCPMPSGWISCLAFRRRLVAATVPPSSVSRPSKIPLAIRKRSWVVIPAT